MEIFGEKRQAFKLKLFFNIDFSAYFKFMRASYTFTALFGITVIMCIFSFPGPHRTCMLKWEIVHVWEYLNVIL